MAGGRGERFWPKSRTNLPKQFLSLTSDGETMIQKTIKRLAPLVETEDIFVVTNAAYKQLDVSAQNDLSQFTDLSSVSAWALPGLRWANQVGLVNGRTSTILAPTGTATRAECAVIIRRFCENIL